jgi:hypothetical protein
MNITRKLYGVGVKPQVGTHSNVVARVHWGLEFERDGFTSVAFIETFLNTSALESFTPIEQLSKEQVLQWAYDAQDGDRLIAEQSFHHDLMLQYEANRVGVVPYPDFPTDPTSSPSAASIPSIPQEVL